MADEVDALRRKVEQQESELLVLRGFLVEGADLMEKLARKASDHMTAKAQRWCARMWDAIEDAEAGERFQKRIDGVMR